MLVEAAAANPAEIDRELDRGNAVPKTLPFKDQAIRAAADEAAVARPNIGSRAIRNWFSSSNSPTSMASALRAGGPTTLVLKTNARSSASCVSANTPPSALLKPAGAPPEVAEAVETGRDPVAEEHAQRAQRERNGLTLADLIAEYIEDQRRSGVATVREIERALNRDIVTTLGHFSSSRYYRLADRGRYRRRCGAW